MVKLLLDKDGMDGMVEWLVDYCTNSVSFWEEACEAVVLRLVGI